MKTFSDFLLKEENEDKLEEAKVTFRMPLKWDDEVATIGFEQLADSDNYKITINTAVGPASYFVDVENDGEISKITGPNVLVSMLNNFILLEKKRLKK